MLPDLLNLDVKTFLRWGRNQDNHKNSTPSQGPAANHTNSTEVRIEPGLLELEAAAVLAARIYAMHISL